MMKKDLIFLVNLALLLSTFVLFSKFRYYLKKSKTFKIRNFNSLLNIINNKSIFGIWKNEKNNKIIKDKKGFFKLKLLWEHEKKINIIMFNKTIYKAVLELTGEDYINGKKYVIGFNNIIIDKKNWKINLINIEKKIFTKNLETIKYSTNVSLDLSQNKNLLNQKTDEILVKLNLNSQKLKFNSNVNYPNNKKNYELFTFSILNLAICIFNFINILIIIFQIFQNNNYGNFYSISFLTFISVFEIIECFTNLFYSFEFNDYFHIFIIASFFNIINFSLLIIKIFNKIGRDHIEFLISTRGYEVYQIKKFIFIFYLKIYVILFFGIYIGLKFFPKIYFFLFYNTLFLLQIIKIWKRNTIFFPKLTYIFFVFLSKQFFNFYYNCYTDNFLNLNINKYLFFISLIIIIVQYSIYLIQRKIGSNIFFSIKNYKESKRYLINKKDLNDDLLNTDCSICYEKFSGDSKDIINGIDNENNIKKKSNSKKNYLIKTKCSHYFHVPCLLMHLNYKENCPICREKIEHFMI